jgi:hypothetical protein
VLGGAVCGPKKLTEEVFKYLRTAGPTLSAFNAWVLLKGLETLKMRIEAQSANALQLARWLEAHPKVARVFYPGLPSHPQYELAQKQQKSGGAIVSFEVKGAREQAWTVVDHCHLLSITANLGDTKTTITHPASTTHGRITPEARAAAGIKKGCCASRSASKRWKTCRPTSNAVWPSSDSFAAPGAAGFLHGVPMQFSDLGLKAELLRAVSEQGYDTPTPIQQQAIPAVLAGHDLMATAQTGTGKTAGFTLPILHRLVSGPNDRLTRVSKKPRVLVLVPTRELAIQVEESVRTYGKHLPVNSLAVFGGVGINPQIANLRRGVDILVATPGACSTTCSSARSISRQSKFSFSTKPTACSTWASSAISARSSPCCRSSVRT